MATPKTLATTSLILVASVLVCIAVLKLATTTTGIQEEETHRVITSAPSEDAARPSGAQEGEPSALPDDAAAESSGGEADDRSTERQARQPDPLEGSTESSSGSSSGSSVPEEDDLPTDAELRRMFGEMFKRNQKAAAEFKAGRISEARMRALQHVNHLVRFYIIPDEEGAIEQATDALLPAFREKVAVEREIESLKQLLAKEDDPLLRQELEYQEFLKASLYLSITDMALEMSESEFWKTKYRRSWGRNLEKARRLVEQYYEDR